MPISRLVFRLSPGRMPGAAEDPWQGELVQDTRPGSGG